MRYRETGEIHLDFHGTLATTIDYIVNNFGLEVLRQLMTRMAQEVYRDIYSKLKAGDAEALAEHWQYFFKREHSDFQLIRHNDGRIELLVWKCPAVCRLKKLGMPVSPNFCEQTKMINDAWSDGTPFKITTEKTGNDSCRQTIIPQEKNHDTQRSLCSFL